MTAYRAHGHQPTAEEIDRLGFRAFGPARPEFIPTADDWQRASRDVATGDADECLRLAHTLADLWPPSMPWWGGGYWLVDDDD